MLSVDTLILVHRFVGYPTAFIVAPLGLLAFTESRIHRRWGKLYLYGMIFLYLTGTYVTLTTHDWNTWSFARNVAFNFFGFSMVLYAWRAIRLFTRPGEIPVERLDRGLAWLLTVSVMGLLAVAIWKDTPMRVFTLLGIVLVVLEWRDLKPGVLSKPLLYRRHQRYILASYFYVLTVVSIVHLNDELPRKIKWLWPAAIGATVIYFLTRRRNAAIPQGTLTRYLVRAVVVLVVLYGGYVAYDLVEGRTISSQGETHQPAAPTMAPSAR